MKEKHWMNLSLLKKKKKEESPKCYSHVCCRQILYVGRKFVGCVNAPQT